MKGVMLLCTLVLVACGPASAAKQITVTQVATVEDCTIYVINDDEKLVICKTSNPALVRR